MENRIVIEKNENKKIVEMSYFNFDLYHEIYKIRSKKDNKNFFDYKKWAHLTDHPLTNRRIHDKKTGLDYTIEGVYQEFYFGYYIN